MLAEFNKLVGLNKKFFESNHEKIFNLNQSDENANVSLLDVGKKLNQLAHFNQEMWKEVASIVKSTPTYKIYNITSNFGVNGYVAGTFMTYLRDDLVPLQKNYDRERRGDYYFYHIGRKSFCTPNEAVDDLLVLGRLVNQGKIDVACLDPFTFFKLLKKN